MNNENSEVRVKKTIVISCQITDLILQDRQHVSNSTEVTGPL